MINVLYDQEYDVLRVVFDNGANQYGDEEYDGLVVFRNSKTSSVSSLLIYDFYKRFTLNRLPQLPSGVEIDFKNDIVPHLPFPDRRKYAIRW